MIITLGAEEVKSTFWTYKALELKTITILCCFWNKAIYIQWLILLYKQIKYAFKKINKQFNILPFLYSI